MPSGLSWSIAQNVRASAICRASGLSLAISSTVNGGGGWTAGPSVRAMPLVWKLAIDIG
jgi:hypothetical protein